MKIIDLSQTIQADMLVYPGDPTVKLVKIATVEQNQCQVTAISMGSHTGTHLDAPRHFMGSGKTLPELSLDRFVGEAVCVKAIITKAPDALPGTPSGTIDLPEQERALIQPKDRVLIQTGWDSNLGSPSYFTDCPVFAQSLLDFLLAKDIRLLGVDLPTVRTSADTSSMHVALLSKEVIIVEGLIHLDQVAGQRFYFAAAPLSLWEGDGSPVRAYGMIG